MLNASGSVAPTTLALYTGSSSILSRFYSTPASGSSAGSLIPSGLIPFKELPRNDKFHLVQEVLQENAARKVSNWEALRKIADEAAEMEEKGGGERGLT